MEKRQAFVCVVIPMSEVRKFVAIDLIGGTILYYGLKFSVHSVIAAMAGSMIGPLLVRRSLKAGVSLRSLIRSHRA
jgi:hypothetical protein